MRTAEYNAAAQKRFRERRNALARLVRGEPHEIAGNLTRHFGKDHERAIAEALIERVARREAR